MAEKIELQIVADNADYIQKTKQVEQATISMQNRVRQGYSEESGLIKLIESNINELKKARLKAWDEKDIAKYNKQLKEQQVELKRVSQLGVEVEKTTEKQVKSSNKLLDSVKKLAVAYLSVTLVMKGVKAIFNSTQQAGDLLKRELQGLKTAGDTLARAIATWNFEKLGEKLRTARQAGKDYADEMDHIADLERELQIEQSRRNIQLSELAKIYRNTALVGADGYKKRQEAAAEYIRIAEEGEKKDIALLDLKLKAELKLARTQAGLQEEYVNATDDRKAAIDEEIKANLTMESTFASYNKEIERYQQLRQNISSMSPIFAKIDVDAAIDMFNATGNLTAEIKRLPQGVQDMVRKSLTELSKMPPEITSIAERYETWGMVTDDVRISMTNSMTAIEQKQADLEKGTIRANTAMEMAGNQLAEAEDETLNERLRKLEKFIEETAKLRDQYEQDQIEQLTGIERIRAEQEFELRQVQLLEDHLRELGTLTEEHYKYLDGLRASANLRAERAIRVEQQTELDYWNDFYDESIAERMKFYDFREELDVKTAELAGELSGKKELEIQAKWLQARIDLIKNSKNPELQARAEIMEADLALIQQKIDGTEAGATLWDKLGFNDEQGEAIEKAVSTTVDALDQIFDARVQDAERTRELLDTQISETQRALEAEMELMKAGYASNVDAKRKELEELQKQREKALKQEEAAIKAKRQLETVTQTVSLISAAAETFKAFPGPLLPIAIATVAAMFAAFATAKIKAAAAAKLAEGGVGTETGIIKGRSHREGGERFLDHVEVERGEMWGVLSKKATAKYGKQFNQIVTSFNKDQIPVQQMSEVNNNILIDVSQTNERLDRVQNELKRLNKHFDNDLQVRETSTARIERKGNRTRIIRK